jgi:hypothetical protein
MKVARKLSKKWNSVTEHQETTGGNEHKTENDEDFSNRRGHVADSFKRKVPSLFHKAKAH